MKKTHLLFLVILIEGYVVLACELLAIRQLIPFVGSGIDTTAIIISAVLLPLAIGYHFGGIAFSREYKKAKETGRRNRSIRQILVRNIIAALILIIPGFSYLFLDLFFEGLSFVGLKHPLLQTAAFSLLFLIVPMFLLGQTVPLTSHYFSRRKLSAITGKMLFFSTIGAFLGSLFSTLVLMPFVGVHYTVLFTVILLLLLLLLVGGRKATEIRLTCLMFLLLAWLLNNGKAMDIHHVVSNNAFNLVSVLEAPDDAGRLIMANRSMTGFHARDPKDRFEYITYTEKYFIDPFLGADTKKIDVLSLGAGGFELGRYDEKNNYVFVDIDPDLKEITEKHVWKKPLQPNKEFVVASAREFVHNDKRKYDLIFIDVYTKMHSIPMEAVTKEFFEEVKARLKDGGVVVANCIGSPSFADAFSVRYYNTFMSVFRTVNRVVMAPNEREVSKKNQPSYDKVSNILHIFIDRGLAHDAVIYTDDKNTYSLDAP